MVNKEFWKEAYKDKWPDGNRREAMAVELFKELGIELIPFGFEAMSNKYNKESPDEKGKPDFLAKINGKDIFLEVTGTDAPNVTTKADLWIRPDKTEYVKKHNLKVYYIHILDKLGVIRFIKFEDVVNSKIISVNIRGIKERYHSIKADKSLSIDQFKKEIKI